MVGLKRKSSSTHFRENLPVKITNIFAKIDKSWLFLKLRRKKAKLISNIWNKGPTLWKYFDSMRFWQIFAKISEELFFWRKFARKYYFPESFRKKSVRQEYMLLDFVREIFAKAERIWWFSRKLKCIVDFSRSFVNVHKISRNFAFLWKWKKDISFNLTRWASSSY